jgi:type VI secretion system Hcp family effector
MPMPAHFTLTGEKQGKIDGCCEMQGREDIILVYGMNHGVSIPSSPTDGLATGKRVHGSLAVIKEYDKSSPKPYQALCTGEHMEDVTIEYQLAIHELKSGFVQSYAKLDSCMRNVEQECNQDSLSWVEDFKKKFGLEYISKNFYSIKYVLLAIARSDNLTPCQEQSRKPCIENIDNWMQPKFMLRIL